MDYLTKDDAKELMKELFAESFGQLESNLSRQLQAQAEKAQPAASDSLNWLDSLISEAEGLSDDDEDEEPIEVSPAYDESEVGDIANNPAIARLNQELSKLKSENNQFKTQWQQEQSRREQAELEKRINTMQAAATKELNADGRVVNSDQMLTLLLQSGEAVEQGDRFVIKKTDKHGELFVPIADELDTLLSGKYSHFAARREGTGSGAAPGGAGSRAASVTSFKYFDRDGKPTVDPGVAMQNDRAGYLQEVAQLQH